jgi:demethylmenaquinone methyltransferase/2-methoxy-6-polyprenyl-1,4-benzoquinol methylase
LAAAVVPAAALVRSGLRTAWTFWMWPSARAGLREAVRVVGSARKVTGVDPSARHVAIVSSKLDIDVVQAMAERLPFVDDRYDFLSMGFALRHVSDLSVVFAEYLRVLKPGGIVCILELSPAGAPILRSLLKGYVRGVIRSCPGFAGRKPSSPQLYAYFWDTIEACVPPERVVAALRHAGFTDVKRFVEIGVFSEYTGRKPSA